MPKNNEEDVAREWPGPIMVLAGPGTGKTQTLGRRIKYLTIEKEVKPDEIVVLTFTTEAAKNMRERISDPKNEDCFIESTRQPELICTMHSLGKRIIGEKPRAFGLKKEFRTLASDDLRKILLEDAAQLEGTKREKGAEVDECRRNGDCEKEENTKCEICGQYLELIRACNYIDFDDQILIASEVLRVSKDILLKYQKLSKYLLLDEYQDINKAQFELIKLLSTNNEEGLYVVGDDDQSIYSWRGGNPDFIRNFEKYFGKSVKVRHLKKCYRCPPNIIEGGLEIVKYYDKERREKPIEEFKKERKEKIIVYNVPSEKNEARTIANLIKNFETPADVLILVPTKRYIPIIKNTLAWRQIGCFSPGLTPPRGLLLFNTIKSWLNDPEDDLRLRLCIQYLMDSSYLGIPTKKARKKENIEERETALKEVANVWREVIDRGKTFWSVLNSNKNKNGLLKNVLIILKEVEAFSELDPGAFLNKIVPAFKPWANIDIMFNEFRESIDRFEGETALNYDITVKILTLQKAKGLEADYVFVVGVTEGIIPKFHDLNIVEKSRLFYVSMTRAKKELYLIHARSRPPNISLIPHPKGQDFNILKTSPFLDLIPDEFLTLKYYRV